ncbi:MAG: ABC transporter ATP-binding protein, partial [Victivallales bacterium]
MKELFHYILFACRISRGKVLFFLLLSIAAAACEALAAASIISAINHGVGLGESNFISRTLLSFIKYLPFSSESSSTLATLLVLTAFFFSLRGALLMFSEWYISSFLGNLYMRLQKELLDALYLADYQTFLSYNIGDLSNIAIVQLKIVVQSLRAFVTVISSSIFVIAYLVLPLLVNYKMAMLAIITFAPMGIIIRHVSRKLKTLSLETVSANGEINGIILQVLSNYRYLKSTGTYQKTYKKLDKIARNIASLMIRISVWGSVSPNVMTPFAVVIICGLTYWQVAVLHSPIIEACAVLGLLYHCAQQAISVPTSYQKFLSTSGSIDVYTAFLGNLLKNAEPSHANRKAPDFSGPIVLHEVSFQYASSSSTVLSEISLTIPQKSFVGFVGESGSGKSTFINMITGLLRPSSGKITVSGTDYCELDIQKLRRSIAYVT